MLYLLHLEPAFKHARHYLGFTAYDDVKWRLERHLAGQGSPLIRAAVGAGCEIILAATMPGDRARERQLKNMGGLGRSCCPLCKPGRAS
jgi:hypothetical protein